MKSHTLRKAVTLVAFFGLIIWLDYITGYEVASFPLYFLPIMLSFFYFGKTGGYTCAVISAIVWTANDVLTGHVYSNEFFRYWNTFTRLVIYVFLVYGLSLYSKTVEANRRRLAQLQALTPVCHACGKLLCPDGKWRPLSEAFAERFSEGYSCGDCTDRHGSRPAV